MIVSILCRAFKKVTQALITLRVLILLHQMRIPTINVSSEILEAKHICKIKTYEKNEKFNNQKRQKVSQSRTGNNTISVFS